jgi:signal transduction histidine kinase
VTGALVALICGALLVLLLGLGQAPEPALAAGLGVVFAAIAIAGFRYARRRGRPATAVYFLVQLPLGYVVFGTAGASTGSQLLLLVLVMQAVLVLSLPWAVAVTLLVPLAHAGMSWSEGLREGTSTLVAALFAFVLTMLHVRERQARTQVAEANEQLRRYAADVAELSATRERNRVARDIHDGLGHHLTVVQMQLQAARAVLGTDPQRAEALLEKAQKQAIEALADVRRSVAALREPRAVDSALPDALRRLADESSEAGVPTAVEVRGSRRELEAELEESLYRVAQEGLTNVRKHARAGSAQVLLDYGDADSVRLEVRDDGRGSDAGNGASAPGFGLVGLRERVSGLGGTLNVESVAGAGMTLRVELPG